MLKTNARISLADLSGAGIVLASRESVAIVRDVIRQVARGEQPGVPSPHVIRLSASGAVSIEGPVEAGGNPVPRSAQLLESLLPGFDAPAEFRPPGALRLVIARAMGTLDLPPYPSLDSFADALESFDAEDPQRAVRDVVERWASAPGAASNADTSVNPPAFSRDQRDQIEGPPTRAGFPRLDRERTGEAATALIRLDPASLTVSDIRRARRATGVSLRDVSEKSRIPVPLLRQLEWGYLFNWPGGLYGRTQLVRYARAAGLDETVVVSALSPLLREMGGVATRSSEDLRTPSGTLPEITIIKLGSIEPEFADEAALEVAGRSTRDHGDARPLLPDPAPFSDAELVIDEPLLLPGATAPLPARRPSRIVPGVAAAAAIALAAYGGYWSQIERHLSEIERHLSWPTPATTARIEHADQPVTRGGARRSPGIHETTSLSARETPTAVSAVGRDPRPRGATETSGRADRPEALDALTDSGEILSPAFASVGSAMFYQGEESAQGGIVRVGSDVRSAVLRITRVVDDNARNFHARPSPDGTQIAFDSDREGERAVYVADADGHNVHRVSGEGFAAIPSWSPDGRSLAFVRAEPDRRGVWNLWTVDLRSANTRRLTSNAEGQPSGGSWFPDGRRIAYSRDDRLVVLDVASGRERTYVSPRPGKVLRTPAVSPDGRRVMFGVEHDGAWLLDLTDGSMLKVLSDPTAENYAWSPDGRRVAYQSRRSGEWGVWVMGAR